VWVLFILCRYTLCYLLLVHTTLFFRLSETLDRFSKKLESVYTASGGKKINLITHSMGGLLVKCFISLHSDVSTSSCILDLWLRFAMFNIMRSCAIFKVVAPFLNNVISFYRYLKNMSRVGSQLPHHSKVSLA